MRAEHKRKGGKKGKERKGRREVLGIGKGWGRERGEREIKGRKGAEKRREDKRMGKEREERESMKRREGKRKEERG